MPTPGKKTSPDDCPELLPEIGFLAWAGPVARIAMIRRELVEGEKWISKEKINRVLAGYQVLPGPEAHELFFFVN